MNGRLLFVCVLAAIFVCGCSRSTKEWFGLTDPAGNLVTSPVRVNSELFAAYRSPGETADKIAFQFYFKDSAGEWKLIFLNIQKPDRPARLFREPLAAKDLPPGSYKIVFSRNDMPIGETVFEILPADRQDRPR